MFQSILRSVIRNVFPLIENILKIGNNYNPCNFPVLKATIQLINSEVGKIIVVIILIYVGVQVNFYDI